MISVKSSRVFFGAHHGYFHVSNLYTTLHFLIWPFSPPLATHIWLFGSHLAHHHTYSTHAPKPDPDPEMSLSPISGEAIPVTDLVCSVTKNDIPFCVVSGYHMVAGDWCICPNSKFPALHSKYVRYLQDSDVDPVCGQPVRASDLVPVDDPKPYIDAYNDNAPEGEEDDDGAKDADPAV